jgi:integrase
MASVHRQKGKPFWYCSFNTRKPDGSLARHFKSTKTANKKQAEEICRAWEQAARQASNGRLTPEAARDVIAAGVADIYAIASGEDLPGASVRTWCDQWVEAKKIESSPVTVERYRNVLDNFYKHIGAKADKDVTLLRPMDVQRFRDHEAKTKSRNTANVSVKVLRAAFNAALKAELIGTNPAKLVDKLKEQGESLRRPFTDAELGRVLDGCKGTELEGLTLFGAFTGQRLSDVKGLTWRQVDLQKGEVSFITSKTGRRLTLPLLKPVQDYLLTLKAGDNPDAPLFPTMAAADASTASNAFYDVLVDVGLATARTKKNTGKGRHAARAVAALTYHSLRHYFVSKLKSGGLSDTVSMAIVGHSTQTIHHQYAHLEVGDLRKAMEAALPDVKGAK